jgi:thioredoxin reductase (NADPH)
VNDKRCDVIIIGAGPCGLACAIAAKEHGLSHLVIEKGCLVNSVYHFPTNMSFFSTPELLEIGNVPMIVPDGKPKRLDALHYYRRVAEHHSLAVRLYERVEKISRTADGFSVDTHIGRSYRSRFVVFATGYYDNPNLLHIPGEDLPKVSHYYTEAHPYYSQKVAVIGGQNSAVEAALDLYRSGAEVTLIHRGETLGRSIKYWIRPDIENRIREGSIRACFRTEVTEIQQDEISLLIEAGRREVLANDYVFALTGYHLNRELLGRSGIRFREDGITPVHDPQTLETNVPGLFVSGVLTAGPDANKIFIENSRHHGTLIMKAIANGTS